MAEKTGRHDFHCPLTWDIKRIRSGLLKPHMSSAMNFPQMLYFGGKNPQTLRNALMLHYSDLKSLGKQRPNPTLMVRGGIWEEWGRSRVETERE